MVTSVSVTLCGSLRGKSVKMTIEYVDPALSIDKFKSILKTLGHGEYCDMSLEFWDARGDAPTWSDAKHDMTVAQCRMVPSDSTVILLVSDSPGARTRQD